jgi:hypothetical protein
MVALTCGEARDYFEVTGQLFNRGTRIAFRAARLVFNIEKRDASRHQLAPMRPSLSPIANTMAPPITTCTIVVASRPPIKR